MARNESQRQKKLARQKKKRDTKRQVLRRQPTGLAAEMRAAAEWPVLDCFVQASLEDEGLGAVLVCRQGEPGQIAVGSFLVDRYCLGVKDAFGRVVSRNEYDEMLADLRQTGRLEKIDPASARRVIEYARELGFSPHADFAKTQPILGDVDPSAAKRLFELGKDGKPLFVNGPYDRPQKILRVLATLERSCGPDGYHTLLIGVPGFDDGLDLIEED
jgi:hypothetical protein